MSHGCEVCRPILLVEDSPVDIDLTRRAFARQKICNPIEVARDGEEALQWIRRWEEGEPRPVLILLDLKLPRVDGLEVLRQLKSHPEFASLPVVVLTTSAEESDVKAAYALGVNSYIVKPVDFDKFQSVVQQVELYWNVINEAPR
jgi:CheY-like chemotaxis protein